MADPRRDVRLGCFIVSLDRIPSHFEEMAAEEWAYDLQNRIPISRRLAKRIEDWRIMFPASIPHTYPPTLRPPREPAQYIPTARTTPFNAGPPPFMRRAFYLPLQRQPLRSESTRPLDLTQPPPAMQPPPSIQPPLQPPIPAQAHRS